MGAPAPHPQLRLAPDDRLGEWPVAVVVAGDDFDEEAFLAWTHEHVAGYRRPRHVARSESIPQRNNEKVDRNAATELVLSQLAESGTA